MRCPTCKYTRFGGEIEVLHISGSIKRLVDVDTHFTCLSPNFRHSERRFPIRHFLLYEELKTLEWKSREYDIGPNDLFWAEAYHIIGATGSRIVDLYGQVLSILKATAVGDLAELLASDDSYIRKLSLMKYDELERCGK